MKGTFCGLPADTDPQKVPGAFMDALAQALRRAPKWLKSSVERLSGKSLCGSNGAFVGSAKRPKRAISYCSAGSRSHELESVRSFQTVSGRGILRSSQEEGPGSVTLDPSCSVADTTN